MSFRFTIRIDDEDHSLTKENGLPIDSIGILLSALAAAIQMPDSKVVLEEIRGNCYALGLYTEDERSAKNFEIVHKNIDEKPNSKLSKSERDYAKAVFKIVKSGFYVEALRGKSDRIVKIRDRVRPTAPTHYHEVTTIYGKIIRFGATAENKPFQMAIETSSGSKHNVILSEEQDEEIRKVLSEVMREEFLRLTVKIRRSLVGESEEMKLENFSFPKNRSLWESIKANKENLFIGIENLEEEINSLRSTNP